MGFSSSNGSSQQAKEVSPEAKLVSKRSSPHNQLKNDLRVKKAGLDQARKNENASNFPEPELKGIDVEDQINLIDTVSEDSDYMWLYSDSLSSSLLSSDDSQDVWEVDCLNLSLQGQFSSMSLLSGNSDVSLDKGNEVFVSDGSKSSSISDMSLILSRQLVFKGKDMEEFIQLGEVGNEGKGRSVSHLEIHNSNQRNLFKDSSLTNSMSALPSKYVDTPLWDFDRTDIWVSSLDLQREDSELIWDRENEFIIFDSNFPSPSFSAMGHLQTQSSSSRSLDFIGQEDKVKSTSTDSDEPLFWPFDHRLYSCLDFEKFLCPSPCKKESNVGLTAFPMSKLTRLRLHENSPQANRKDIQRLRRRGTPSPMPKSVTAECGARGVSNGAEKTALTPSRLSRSTKAPSNLYQCSISKRRGRPQLKIDVARHGGSSSELLNQPLKELELCDPVLKGVSIENLVGLNEFDGHEGINADFEEEFTFYSSPFRGLMRPKTIECIKGQ